MKNSSQTFVGRIFCAAVLMSLIIPCFGQKQPDANTELQILREEVLKLKYENQLLRDENQTLRKLLAERTVPSVPRPGDAPATGPGGAPVTPSPAPTVKPAQPTLTHWMTLSSGKRHNASCRYYQNSRGRACGPNDGIACKICGG